MLDKTPAYQRILTLLQQAIASGDIPPGAVIKIAEIAKIFSASRSPVKRAFGMLEDSGLVRAHDGQGFVVAGAAIPTRFVLTPQTLGLQDSAAIRPSDEMDSLYFMVEREIILHSMWGDLRINELALARHYGVGRPVARDLIYRAQNAGIVTRGQGAHWRIVKMDEERCRNLYNLRRILEPIALRCAATLIPTDVLTAMTSRLDSAIARVPNLDVAELDRLESDLHQSCLSYSPNTEIVESLVRATPTYVCGKYLQTVLTDNPTIESFMHEHREILQLMVDGLVDEAAKLLDRHLAESTEQTVQRLKDYIAKEAPRVISYIW